MNKRIFLVGLIGGLLVSGALYYPLYRYLPSGFVEGWPSADGQVAIICLVVASILLFVTGFIAGRISGARNRLGAAGAGAASGLTAALVAEVLIAGAAAGVWGAKLMLAHGLHATRDDAEFLSLLTHAVSSIVWWTYLSIWIATGVGLLIGGLGGLAVGKTGKQAYPQPGLWLSIAAAGVLASALNLIAMILLYALLSRSTQNAANGIAERFIEGYTLPYPSESMLWWAAATNLAWLIFWQFIAWRLLRHLPAAWCMAFLLVGMTLLLVLPGLLLLFQLSSVAIAIFTLLLVMGILWVALKILLRSRMKSVQATRFQRAWNKLSEFFARVGQARATAGYFLFISLSTTLLVCLLDRDTFLLPWVSGGLMLNILFAVLGLRDVWKSGPPPSGEIAFPTTHEFFAGALLGGSFCAILTLLNCLAPLTLVLLPIEMLIVLTFHDEGQAVAAAGSQTLSSIVQTNYTAPVMIVAAAGVAVTVMAILVTVVGTAVCRHRSANGSSKETDERDICAGRMSA